MIAHMNLGGRIAVAVALAGAGIAAACGADRETGAGAVPWPAQRLQRAAPWGPKPMGTGHPAEATPGNARVGALFNHDAGGDHYCTGSVVHSESGDMVITAAHCIHGGRGSGYRSDIVFVPNYRSGQAPQGQWEVKSLAVDQRWIDKSDPDLDVGFVVLQPNGGRHIEDVLGANALGISTGFNHLAKITGYPARGSEPVSCINRSTRLGAAQMRIACTGFPGGTSGSPWLTSFNPTTRTGVIIGVIGGRQGGGKTPDVSYSSYFGQDVEDLYLKAAAE